MKCSSLFAIGLASMPFFSSARLQGTGDTANATKEGMKKEGVKKEDVKGESNLSDGMPGKGRLPSANKENVPDFKRTLIGEHDLKPGEELDEKRYLDILKKAWPECVRYYMTAMQCKEQVDHDIQTINTGVHTTIRSVIVFKREENDSWYNSVAIQMDDNDHVLGRDNDGMVYYDFPWDGKGVEASPVAQRSIPLLELDPDTEEPVPVVGATIDDSLAGRDKRPIAGGRFNPAAQSSVEIMDKLNAALNKQKRIQAGGLRTVGPWNCTGMTGVDCCMMIRAEVRDADMNDNAIQCYLDYKKGTEKEKEDLTPRRDHLGFVSQVPRVG